MQTMLCIICFAVPSVNVIIYERLVMACLLTLNCMKSHLLID